MVRPDRLISAAPRSRDRAEARTLDDLPTGFLDKVEGFLAHDNWPRGQAFRPRGGSSSRP